MLIDAHNHPNWHGHDAKKILENMDEHGIDQMWLFSWEVSEDEYDPSYHKVLPPGGTGIPLEDVLQVGDNPEDDAIAAIRLYQACGEMGLPITIHLDYPLDRGSQTYPRPNYWYGGSIEAFERAIIACPETTFIGHAPGFWAHISGDDKFDKEAYPKGPVLPGGKVPDMLRKHDNLIADLSAGSALTAISRDPEFGKNFLIEFQDKMLWARDYFDGALMSFFKSLDLPKDVFD